MLSLIIRWLIVALGLWLAERLIPGMTIANNGTLLFAALLLGLVNAVVRPIIVFLTFPITLVTLGLFLLIINAAMLGLVAKLLDNFTIDGLVPAVVGSIIVSLTGWIASIFIGKGGHKLIGRDK